MNDKPNDTASTSPLLPTRTEQLGDLEQQMLSIREQIEATDPRNHGDYIFLQFTKTYYEDLVRDLEVSAKEACRETAETSREVDGRVAMVENIRKRNRSLHLHTAALTPGAIAALYLSTMEFVRSNPVLLGMSISVVVLGAINLALTGQLAYRQRGLQKSISILVERTRANEAEALQMSRICGLARDLFQQAAEKMALREKLQKPNPFNNNVPPTKLHNDALAPVTNARAYILG